MIVSIIIRGRDETTLPILRKQLLKQKEDSDSFHVLNDAVPFEEKLKESFEVAINDRHLFSIIIDADIIVTSSFIKETKKLINKLHPFELGFGLKVLDRFYGSPKFRGIHVYNVNHLAEALSQIPKQGNSLRPETFVKQKMAERGHPWQNNISNSIFGIHDFFQNSEDIFCKMAIRSHRSARDIKTLLNRFKEFKSNPDFTIAEAALEYGMNLDRQEIENNREIYIQAFHKAFPSLQNSKSEIPFFVKKFPDIYVRYLLLIEKYLKKNTGRFY